ncbi:chromodomain-containing protein chromator isoform X2 [Rhynchophorus ferrugineus]|uniref:chromodomain-containing protein chromator isoform X2 n=1 Tax=Rhynchophorus ferrugineus TaxID=354439 RepID=UPI003FCE7D3F
MDEISKEPGHRASVSMPSLDVGDDFPVPTTSTLNTDQTNSTFVCTDTQFTAVVTDALVTSSDALTPDSISYSSVDTPSLENTQSLEAPSVEDNTEVLPQPEEGLDDSQGEEDPSIAIDQFIKRIADEQLSSKRIGSQEEKENDQEKEISEDLVLQPENKELLEGEDENNIEDDKISGIPVEDNALPAEPDNVLVVPENVTSKPPLALMQDTNSLPLENDTLPDEALALSEINESTMPVKSEEKLSETDIDLSQNKEPEPMDIDESHLEAHSKENVVPKNEPAEDMNEDTRETESPSDFMQAESIEEIQKEIDKIPPKKITDSTQNGKIDDSLKINPDKNENENHTQKSIEQILCDGLEKAVTDDDEKYIFGNDNTQDTSGVSRDRILIDKAQEEIKKFDVLVCGECHNTFYFIEEFTAHKNGKCTKVSTITSSCENESKPQVWGYVLWRIKQAKELGLSSSSSSWSMYQKWCKLPEDDKNAWITAGQSIQFASKISGAKITEVKGKQNKQVLVQKVVDNETLPLEFVDSNKENSDSLDGDSSPSNIIKKTINKPVKLNNDVTIMPSNKIGSPHRDQTNTAIRTTKILSTQKQEFPVEKIVAKRFNPRKKTWEYNIKWESFPSESNTWEPVSNLGHCKLMLEKFEEQLKRVKEEKAKQTQTAPKGRGRPPNRSYNKSTTSQYVPIAPKVMSPKMSNVMSDDYASGSGRPQRSSKQKALNQVKAWCGNISDDDSTGYKRKHDDDSDEDYDEKRIKLEEESDDSDKDIKPKISVKKVGKPTTPITVKNGSTGSQQILPSNILIPDANGVVRINQKQLPSLSSGVYIMSKTAGIIKLDSSTSKVATSGGQTIVKVAPKIGQTQIKIVKKEGNTTKQIIQISPKTVASSPIKVTPVKVSSQKNPVKIRKGSPLSTDPTKVIRKYDQSKLSDERSDEDSDDGLEPLPFPALDDPLPEPESPPGEFVLDPETGKIAGREYVDKPVVIKEEPQSVPQTTNELENIVKLAAADITEEDLQGDTSVDTETMTIAQEPKNTIVQTIKADVSSSGHLGVRRVVKYTTSHGLTEGSILNKALTQAGQQRAIISSVKAGGPQQHTRVVQQKVINSMVTQRVPGHNKTIVRHVIAPQGSHGNMNVIRTRTVVPKPKFNLAPQKPLPSPLQPTRTYSSVGGVRQQIGGNAANKVQVYSTKSTGQMGQAGGMVRKGPTVVRNSSGQMGGTQKVQGQYPQRQTPTKVVRRVVTSARKSEPSVGMMSSAASVHNKVQASKPKAVINMPSLTDDDTSMGTITKAQKPPGSSGAAVSSPIIKQEALSQSESLENDALNQQETSEAVSNDSVTDWSSFTMADSDNPIYITGDDGTIYQVAGQNEQGQTILITQGPDGQQQCLLVTNEVGDTPAEEQPNASEVAPTPESVLAIPEDNPLQAVGEATPTSVAAALVDDSAATVPLQIKTDVSEIEGIEEGMQDQVVAQVVRAEPPSPGGTHKVVVMLPDGNLMVTQVSPEEYASLELE